MFSRILIHITDDHIVIYRASNRSMAFYKSYDVSNEQQVSDLCTFLEREKSTSLYIYLDTAEVSFEQKVFSNITRSEADMAVRSYVMRKDHVIAGAVKLDPFRTISSGTSKAKKDSVAINKHQYIVFLVLGNLVSKSLRIFLNFISHGNNKIAIVSFLPSSIVRSRFTSNAHDVVTINIRIDEKGRIATVASYGRNFIVNRHEVIDISEYKNLKEDIESTIWYIETTLTGNVHFAINIMTDIKISAEDIKLNSVTSRINISNSSTLGALYGKRITKLSANPIDDMILAAIHYNRTNDKGLTNNMIEKKHTLFLAIAIMQSMVVLCCVAIAAWCVKNISTNIVKRVSIFNAAKTKLKATQNSLLHAKNKNVNLQLLDEMKACISLANMELNKAKYWDMILSINNILATEKYMRVEQYKWSCIDKCDTVFAVTQLDINAILINESRHYEDMKEMYAKFVKVVQSNYGKYNVNIPELSIINQDYSFYRTVITVKNEPLMQ